MDVSQLVYRSKFDRYILNCSLRIHADVSASTLFSGNIHYLRLTGLNFLKVHSIVSLIEYRYLHDVYFRVTAFFQNQ